MEKSDFQIEEELASRHEIKNNVLSIKDEVAKRFLEAIQNGHEGSALPSLGSNVPPFSRHK